MTKTTLIPDIYRQEKVRLIAKGHGRYAAPLLATAGTGVSAVGITVGLGAMAAIGFSLAAAWLAGADISHWGRTGTWRMRWGRGSLDHG